MGSHLSTPIVDRYAPPLKGKGKREKGKGKREKGKGRGLSRFR